MGSKTLGQYLVAGQFVGITLSVLALRFTEVHGSAFWLLFSFAGLILGIVTLFYNRLGNFGIHPAPLQGTQLVTSGPYRLIRHPMYLSVILVLLGLALFARHWMGFAGLVLATISVVWKSFLEERYLASKFAGYSAYKAGTQRIIPFVF